MLSVLETGLSSLGSSPGSGYYIVFFEKNILFEMGG